MRKAFRLAALVSALVAASVFFLYLSENKGTSEGGTTASEEQEAGSLLEDVRVVSSRAGVVQWELKASKIEFDANNTRASLSEMEVNVPDASIALKSDAGSYDTETGALVMRGDVTGRREGVMIAFGSDVALAPGGKTVESDAEVTIEAPGYRISGKGLVADENGVRIRSDVRAEIN